MVASLWGMRSVDDLDFSLYFPYPFVPLISLNFLLVSKSLVLYWGQLVRLSFGDWSLSSILIHHLCLMICWPNIIWAPGCQTIGESHSGDTETLWYDGYRFIRSRARSAFGNYSLPIRFNCLFELGAGGLEGLIGLPA